MKTVGSILKKARQSQGLDYKKIGGDTKIPPKFLKALEESDWSKFSSPIYAKGFLKNYAGYLGLKISDVLAFWRREYQDSGIKQGLKSNIKPLNTPRFVVTPGVAVSAISTLSILLFFGYLFYQYHSFAGAPLLIVDQPKEDLTTAETVLDVAGRTDRDAQVFINGQKINLGEKGTFSANLTLAAGINTINIQSQNKLGRKSTVSRTVIVEGKKEAVVSPPGEVAATESAKTKPTVEGLNVEVKIGPNASWLEVIADGVRVFEGLLVAGTEKVFTVKDKLLLKTGNAGSTKVFVNGQPQELLGNEGGVAEHEYKR